jgi:hypothetical protein
LVLISVKTGDYLIFPGNTVHATEESFSDEDRIGNRLTKILLLKNIDAIICKTYTAYMDIKSIKKLHSQTVFSDYHL